MHCPPIAEQTTIANYLDEKTAQIDELIESKQKLIELLKEERTAIINRAVTKGTNPKVKLKPSGIEWLGDVPRDWEVVRLKKHIDLITGFAFKSDLFSRDSGVKLVRGINVKEGVLNWDDTRLWNHTSIELSEFYLKDNDILIGMDGSKVGKNYCLVKEIDLPLLLVQRVARLRVKELLRPMFLYYFIGNVSFLHWVNITRTDPAVPHISPADIKNYRICVPNLKEQDEIVAHIKNETFLIDTAISDIEKEIELMQEYRTALISEVVTGKVNVA